MNLKNKMTTMIMLPVLISVILLILVSYFMSSDMIDYEAEKSIGNIAQKQYR